ncbi:MAG: alpha/beta hydrolase [Phormidesmis sp.]
MRQYLEWPLALILCFLSLWIVLPAPSLFWLQLAVGAPEVSPLLVILSAIALFIVYCRRQQPPKLLVLTLVLSLALSSLPWLQQPIAITKAENSIATAFAVPQPSAAYPTFSWLSFFRGFPATRSSTRVRHQAKIPFATPQTDSQLEEPLYLDLYQPPETGQYPTIVMIYGGGWSAGDSSQNANFGDFFAARGYVVVAIEYRLTPKYRFPTQVEDVNRALAFVRQQAEAYEIDRDRIALLGWSAGAHLAMLEGFQSAPLDPSGPEQPGEVEPLNIRGIVDYYGPVDLAAGYTDPPVPDPLDVQQVLAAFIGGPPSEFPEAYAEASPITYVKAAAPNSLPPVLLLYGGRDHIVEAKYGRLLYDQLRASGNTAVWVRIPFAEHAFDKIFNGVSNQLALHFVERFLAQTL